MLVLHINGLVQHSHLAACWHQACAYHRQQRGFARTRGTDQCHMLTRAHLQMYALERHQAIRMNKVELIERDAHEPWCFISGKEHLANLK